VQTLLLISTFVGVINSDVTT